MPGAQSHAAEAVMPLKGTPPVSRDWTSLGLPEKGWVMVTDKQQCALCPKPADRACAIACADTHNLQQEARLAMGICEQCDPAPCEDACPADAISHTAQGVVQVDQELCIGCQFCVDVCPSGALVVVDPYAVPTPAFGVSDYTAGRPTGELPGTVAKCTLCSYRLLDGSLPVCVQACPHGGVWVGNLERNTATNGQCVVRLSDLLGQRNYMVADHGRRVIDLID